MKTDFPLSFSLCPSRLKIGKPALAVVTMLALLQTAPVANSQTYLWNVNGSGTWNSGTSWLPSGTFPNGSGSVADVTFNITTSATITLTASSTVGILNAGDTNFSSPYEFAGTNGALLVFDNTANSAPAQLNVSGAAFQGSASGPFLLSSLGVQLNSSLNFDVFGTYEVGNNGSIDVMSPFSSGATSGTQTLSINSYLPSGEVLFASTATISNGSTGGTIGVSISGPGFTDFVSTANTYTGATAVNGGTLLVGNIATEGSSGGTASSLGASGNAASNLILNGGLLEIGSGTTDRLFTIGAAGASIQAQNGPLYFTNTNALVFSSSTSNTSLTLTSPTVNAVNRFTPQITDPGAGFTTTLNKTGIGTWVLSGSSANTYSGGTVVKGGRLALSGAAATFGTGTITVQNTGVVETLNSTFNGGNNAVVLVTSGSSGSSNASAPGVQMDTSSATAPLINPAVTGSGNWMFLLNGGAFNTGLTYTGALNMAGIGNGYGYLGAGSQVQGSTYAGLTSISGLLSADLDNVYRLGAGGAGTITGTLSITGAGLADSGSAASLIVGMSGSSVGLPDSLPSSAAATVFGGNGTVILNNSSINTYSGATTVNPGSTLILDSRLANTSGVTLNGGTVVVDYTTNTTTINRLPDNAPVTLNSGTLVLKGSGTGTSNVSETVGAISVGVGGGPSSYITISDTTAATPTGTTSLIASSLTRSSLGTPTLILSATGGTAGTASANLGTTENLIVNGGVQTTNGIVAPWMVGQNNDANKSGFFLTTSTTAGAGSSVSGTMFYAFSATNGDQQFAAPLANTIETVSTTVSMPTLSSNASVYALAITNNSSTLAPQGIAVNSGVTLSIGTGLAGGNAGLILNGVNSGSATTYNGVAAILGSGTLSYGASELDIYVNSSGAFPGNVFTGGGEIATSISGSGNLVLMNGNLFLTGTENQGSFNGNIIIDQGLLSGTPGLVTQGYLEINSSGTFSQTSGAVAVGGLYGNGYLSFGANPSLFVNYTGATQDVFSGTMGDANSNGYLTFYQVGPGTLVLTATNAYPVSVLGGGTLINPGDSNIYSGGQTYAAAGSTLVLTGTAGFETGGNKTLDSGLIDVAPSGTGGNVVVYGNSESNFSAAGGTFELNKGQNNSVAFISGPADQSNFGVFQNAGGQGVIIAPGDGLGNLGTTDQFIVLGTSGTVYSSGTVSGSGPLNSANGIVAPYIVGEDTTGTMDFLVYSGSGLSTDIGLQAASVTGAYTDTNFSTVTSASTVEWVTSGSSVTLSGANSVYALRNDGSIAIGAGNQLFINGTSTTTASPWGGLIMNNGASILGAGSLSFSGAQGLVTLGGSSTIGTLITNSSTLGIMGAGTLELSGSAGTGGGAISSVGSIVLNSGVTLQVDTGTNTLKNTEIVLNGGVIQTTGTYSPLLANAGSTAGDLNMSQGGGFAATSGTLTVRLGNGSNSVGWGGTGFLGDASGGMLTFGSTTANGLVNFTNGLDLSNTGTSPTNYYSRVIDVIANSTSASNDIAQISGSITSGTGGVVANNGDASAQLVKTGNGILFLSASNAYTGGTVISQGTLQINTVNSLGAGNLSIGNGTLEVLGTSTNSITDSRNFTIGGTASTIQVDSGVTYSVSGSMSDNYGGIYGNNNLVKTGAGTLFLSGTNTYSGSTIVNGGVLEASGTAALPSLSRIAVNSGGTLAVQTSTGGAGAGWSAANIGTLLTSATFNAGSALGIDTTNGDFTYGSAIAGNQGLTKLGSNALILSAVNTYSGATTVNAGSLLVASTGGLSSSPVTVSGSGTLGTGGAASGGATLSTLNLVSLALNTNSTLSLYLDTLSTNSDMINAGTLTLSGTAFNFTLTASSNTLTGSAYTLLTWANTGLSGIAGDVSVNFNSTSALPTGYVLQEVDGSSSDSLELVASAVPEPGIWALLGLGGCVVFGSRYPRRRGIAG